LLPLRTSKAPLVWHAVRFSPVSSGGAAPVRDRDFRLKNMISVSRSAPLPIGLLETRWLNRLSAVAHMGLTVGRFEQLIREAVIPDAVIIDGGRFWDASALDQALQAVQSLGKAFVYPERSKMTRAPGSQCKSEEGVVSPGYCLPDEAWLQERGELVARVRRSFPSQNEMGLLIEFKHSDSDQLSMFGRYKSFEALMARGYVVEVSRSGPSSRQLVTYKLTEQGQKAVAAMKDRPDP
jgi:hypothetical protein